jgi:ribosomal protein S18 acetylase RimI-like enzyme
MKEILILLPGFTMVAFASWYAYKTYKGTIKPALSTWVIMFTGVLLSILTYLISSHFNYLGAALNFGDVLCGVIIISTILLTQKFSLHFRLFEKWYLLAAGVIVAFWAFSKNAFISNLLVQTILVVSYLPTIQKIVTDKKNSESTAVWGVCLFASVVSLYTAFASGNILSLIYVGRSIFMVMIVMSLGVYFDYFYKRKKMNVKFNIVTISDLQTLRDISYHTYHDTFLQITTPEIMEAYLTSAFNPEKLTSELHDPNSTFFFLYKDDVLVGYLKVNENESQNDLKDQDSLELERVYVKSEFHGQGFGKMLIDKGVVIAKQKKKKFAWLGVWENNTKAIAFYEKMGFHKTTTHDFYMGNDRQTDYIMKLNL